MTGTYLSKNSSKIWAIANVIALLYFATSALYVVRSFFWLPSFPTLWYDLQNIMYWPFQPYLDLTLAIMGGQGFPYNTYALLSRCPFLIIPLVVWAAAWRRARPSSGKNLL